MDHARSSTLPPVDRPPLFVRMVDPIGRRLLAAGMQMGPNMLLTVRGRRSGLPRAAGVAVVTLDGRRWIVGAYGDVHWVRNLRAAREATIRIDDRDAPVDATELNPTEATAFFRERLPRYVAGLPFPARMASRLFSRDMLRDPEGASARHPVFELRERSDG